MIAPRPTLLLLLLFTVAHFGCSPGDDEPDGAGGSTGGTQGTGAAGGSASTGGSGGAGAMPANGTVAAIDCDGCSGLPVDQNGCDNNGTGIDVFAACRIADIPGPTLTLQFVLDTPPDDCPPNGDGTKDLLVADQCELVIEHIDGTEFMLDWDPFFAGNGGDCFENPDCPGRAAERYGADWVDVPVLSGPPFNGMDGTCEDIARVGVRCGGTDYQCDYTTPSRGFCE
ncbi:MAG: hypothetical protein AAF436_09015 [Myxococcota bacterium]